jgi:hypothetical protein
VSEPFYSTKLTTTPFYSVNVIDFDTDELCIGSKWTLSNNQMEYGPNVRPRDTECLYKER